MTSRTSGTDDAAGGGPGGDRALRVSDAERAAVADRLLVAHGEGRLTLVEFDERVRDAHAATVRADLVGLTADLPLRPRPVRPPAPARRAGLPSPPGGDLRSAAGAWALVSLLNVVIWVAVVVGVGHPVYPWWIWVAGPWGAMLALRALTETCGVARVR